MKWLGVNQNIISKYIISLLLVFVGSASSNADILPAIQDSYTHGIAPSINYGTTNSIRVRNWGPSYGFVEFDVSSVAGSIIDSATLVVKVSEVNKPGEVDVHLVNGAWDESTLTFNNQPMFDAPTSSFLISSEDVGGTVSIDVTSIVQGWSDGTIPNHGLVLTSPSINVVLGSKEGGGSATLDLRLTRTRVTVPTNYNSVQKAIDDMGVTWCLSVTPRCTIVINTGVFDGFRVQPHMDVSPLAIVGAGESATVIGKVVIDGVESLELRNLTVKGDGTTAVLVEGESGERDDVLFDDVTVVDGWISVDQASDVILSDVNAGHVSLDAFAEANIIDSEIVSITAFEGSTVRTHNSSLGDVGTGNAAVVNTVNSTIDDLILDDGGISSFFGTQIFGTVRLGSGTSAQFGNSRISGDIAIEEGVAKCTNVLDQEFNEYLPDCTKP